MVLFMKNDANVLNLEKSTSYSGVDAIFMYCMSFHKNIGLSWMIIHESVCWKENEFCVNNGLVSFGLQFENIVPSAPITHICICCPIISSILSLDSDLGFIGYLYTLRIGLSGLIDLRIILTHDYMDTFISMMTFLFGTFNTMTEVLIR